MKDNSKVTRCTLTNDELAHKVLLQLNDMYETRRIPSRNVPAEVNDDFDLLVGEMIYRFNNLSIDKDTSIHNSPKAANVNIGGGLKINNDGVVVEEIGSYNYRVDPREVSDELVKEFGIRRRKELERKLWYSDVEVCKATDNKEGLPKIERIVLKKASIISIISIIKKWFNNWVWDSSSR